MVVGKVEKEDRKRERKREEKKGRGLKGEEERDG